MTEDTRPDDGNRGATGLAVSVVELPDGKVWLVLGDVRRTGHVAPFQWHTEWFFTRSEVDAEDLCSRTPSLAQVALKQWQQTTHRNGGTWACVESVSDKARAFNAYAFDAWAKL